MHWLYILRCADDSLYIGETSDLNERLVAHSEGRSKHTAVRRPVALVFLTETDGGVPHVWVLKDRDVMLPHEAHYEDYEDA